MQPGALAIGGISYAKPWFTAAVVYAQFRRLG